VTHRASEDNVQISFTVPAGFRGPVIIELAGELDIVSAPAVREHLLSLLRPSTSHLIIDLSAIPYADASGLAVLVSTQRRAVLLGGTTRLAAPQPEVARVLTVAGIRRRLQVYPTVQAALAGWASASGTILLETGLPVKVRAAGAAGNGELRAAIAALLANTDAWRDADPRRQFAPALRALAQAHAGASYAAMTQATQSLLAVLSKEPLTYSPAVAATASRLRGLFPPGPQLAMG
jgi:anti-anti-sigma factor